MNAQIDLLAETILDSFAGVVRSEDINDGAAGKRCGLLGG